MISTPNTARMNREEKNEHNRTSKKKAKEEKKKMSDRKSSSHTSREDTRNMNREMSHNMVAYPVFNPYMQNMNHTLNHPSHINPMMMNMGPNWQGNQQIPFGWQFQQNSGMNRNYQNYNHEMSGRQSRMSTHNHNTNMPYSSRDTSNDSRYSNTHLSTSSRREGSNRSRMNTYDSAVDLNNPAANNSNEGNCATGSKTVDAIDSKTTVPPKEHHERQADAPNGRSSSLKGLKIVKNKHEQDSSKSKTKHKSRSSCKEESNQPKGRDDSPDDGKGKRKGISDKERKIDTQKQNLKTSNPSQNEPMSKSDVREHKDKHKHKTIRTTAEIHQQQIREAEYQEFDLSNPSITSDSDTSSDNEDSDDSQATSDTNDSSNASSESGSNTSESGSCESEASEESEESGSDSKDSDTCSDSESDTNSSDSDEVVSQHKNPPIKNQNTKSISHTSVIANRKNTKVKQYTAAPSTREVNTRQITCAPATRDKHKSTSKKKKSLKPKKSLGNPEDKNKDGLEDSEDPELVDPPVDPNLPKRRGRKPNPETIIIRNDETEMKADEVFPLMEEPPEGKVLVHKTDGAICGGSTDMPQYRYLMKAGEKISFRTPKGKDEILHFKKMIRDFIHKMKLAGNDKIRMYTIIAVFNTMAEGYNHTLEGMLKLTCTFRSFRHFSEIFITTNWPNIFQHTLLVARWHSQIASDSIETYYEKHVAVHSELDRPIDESVEAFIDGIHSDELREKVRYHDYGEDRTLADVREFASKMAQNLKMEAARRREIASRGRGSQSFGNNNNRRGFGRYNRNNFQSRSMSNTRNNGSFGRSQYQNQSRNFRGRARGRGRIFRGQGQRSVASADRTQFGRSRSTSRNRASSYGSRQYSRSKSGSRAGSRSSSRISSRSRESSRSRPSSGSRYSSRSRSNSSQRSGKTVRFQNKWRGRGRGVAAISEGRPNRSYGPSKEETTRKKMREFGLNGCTGCLSKSHVFEKFKSCDSICPFCEKEFDENENRHYAFNCNKRPEERRECLQILSEHASKR